VGNANLFGVKVQTAGPTAFPSLFPPSPSPSAFDAFDGWISSSSNERAALSNLPRCENLRMTAAILREITLFAGNERLLIAGFVCVSLGF